MRHRAALQGLQGAADDAGDASIGQQVQRLGQADQQAARQPGKRREMQQVEGHEGRWFWPFSPAIKPLEAGAVAPVGALLFPKV